MTRSMAMHVLRAADPPVRGGGRLVGGDRPAAHPVGGDLVDAGHLGRGHQRLDAGGERVAGVGAHVADDVDVEGEDAAVGVERGAGAVVLLAGQERGGQRVRAVLDPLHRPVAGAAPPRRRRSPRGRPRTSGRSRRPCPARRPGRCARAGAGSGPIRVRTWCGTWVQVCTSS